MSTFIAALGFDAQPLQLQSAKSSILAVSLLSAMLGVLYLRFIPSRSAGKQTRQIDEAQACPAFPAVRCLNEQQAASYLGLGRTLFREVAPFSIRLRGCPV
jgi:hypothetical protein